VPVLIGFRA